MALRMLVTGSQTWDDPVLINRVLFHYAGLAAQLDQRLLVTHGAAVRGADDLTSKSVVTAVHHGWGVAQDKHPADWTGPCTPGCNPGHRQTRATGKTYCPYAGFRRNDRMVGLRPQVCVGFWRNNSSGTRHCMKQAERAGVPVLRLRWTDRELYTPDWLGVHAPKLVLP